MVCMLYSTIPTPAGLAVYLAGRPTETRPDTPGPAVPRPGRPALMTSTRARPPGIDDSVVTRIRRRASVPG